MDKKEVLKLVLQEVETNLQILINSAVEAREASTSEESKAENKYDTRGLEASYLAGAQAKRAESFKEVVYKIRQMALRDYSDRDPIGISALVELEVEGQSKWIFILPASGITVSYKGVRIQVVTLEAPLGRAMWNKKAGDEFTFNGKEYGILKVY